MNDVLIKVRSSEPVEQIHSFYKAAGYGGGAAEQDYMLLAVHKSDIVGVVRISTEDSIPVLRGMYIDEDFRGRGIGSLMLNKLTTYLNSLANPCFCVPYSHLERFYGEIGFRPVEEHQAPNFLVKRCRGYTESGLKVILMRRDLS